MKKQLNKPNTTKSAPLSVAQFKSRVLQHINYTLGTHAQGASKEAWWRATCLAVNEVIFERLQKTHRDHIEHDVRAVNYLSLEYLMGRLLSDNLHNLNLFPVVDKALTELGMELSTILEEGPDLALGNGGLGRLAACYLDSLATKELPAIGYGIHYEHGLFKQYFDNGRQIEVPDEWREYGNPWEVCRPESIQKIPLYGYVETEHRSDGSEKKTWHGATQIKGVPWDVPVVGYNSNTVNILRLWESRSADHLDLAEFNAGAHHDAQRDKVHAETISKILYPGDDSEAGRELRFIQQYFFCACSIKDIVRRYQRKHKNDWSQFTDKVVIQLNDTHPTIAILELMRVLVDDNDQNWFVAWDMCRKIFAYTNHTLLPEALEKWSVNLFERVLPRHLELLYQINELFLNEEVNKRWPGDMGKRAALSLIEEGPDRMVRMANLCVVSAFKVNGVAEIHSKLVKQDLFPDFAAIWPDKFINVTNGITPRR
ncbi:MAG: glycogen/starch/alpha-glucan family phosphorylase, partial [Psychrosphaera sp.]|nr:glycogen/starch/alpha-glucan family phosphorylase [Psychrosphaera sp.]